MDQIVLFGDSITQQSFSQQKGFGFGAELSDRYARRLDVINRGFSGYNTARAIQVLPYAIPPPEKATIRLLTIFFGANDSRLPHTPPPTTPQQHLPPADFKSNLQTLLSHPRVKSHARARIILVTPPPVDERMLRATDAANIPGFSGLRRTARTTAMYAEVVREVGRERGVGVCDVWGGMVGRAGWRDGDGEGEEGLVGVEGARESAVLRGFLSDGLHLSPEGYKVLFEELMETVKTYCPELLPENLPMVLPDWKDLEAWEAFEGRESAG
ncbi:hypothetical protein WHR41_02380 [Cladosporium halotolerans]|uniref:SGNH hydrolase-type esterase domain-containing protein n=1 Tax=Cladosporium halotolerans TaxID=1052096 RepID=A0AB34KX02_9PEZI